ncbi:MAG: hypothetical protein PHX01_04485 [Clostridia bacterium]|nr:hypothetical protein [Clostridia bacterium]
MGFWADFKKEVLDEMGKDWEELKQEVAEIAEEEMETAAFEAETAAVDRGAEKRIKSFVKKFKTMAEQAELNKKVKKEVEKELNDLQKIALGEIKERRGRGSLFPGRREKLYNKYGGKTASEAAFKIARNLNRRYNHEQSNDALWINANVCFLKYRALNDEEFTDLQRLEEKARSLNAERVVQKVKEIQQELMEEEKYLDGAVQSTNPDNYGFKFFGGGKARSSFGNDCYDVKILLEDKLALYTEDGRPELLRAYNICLEELRGQPNRVETVILHLEKQLDPKKTLEEQSQAAQVLRAEPQQENKDERAAALRKKLEREKATRPTFDRAM